MPKLNISIDVERKEKKNRRKFREETMATTATKEEMLQSNQDVTDIEDTAASLLDATEIFDTLQPLEDSKTVRNLWLAFIGESMARNRYTYYASAAKKAGYEEMAAYFTQTADNEKEHAKIWFKQLKQLCDPRANLITSAAGEHHEWMEMYPGMAKTARAEGYEELADLFDRMATIERHHEQGFQELLRKLDEGTFFHRDETTKWKCRNCGFVSECENAPETCPVCNHPQGYYEAMNQGDGDGGPLMR